MTYTLPPTRSPLSFARILQWTACLALAALLYWWLEPSSAKEAVNWRPDFAAAQAEAQRTNKLVFAEFGATWCGPCQEMRRSVWSDKRVASALDSFVPVQIDVDQHAQLASQFQIETIPAMFLISRDGRIVQRVEHAMDRSEFLDWLNHSRR